MTDVRDELALSAGDGARPPVAIDVETERQRWRTLWVVLLGTWLVTLDTTIVNVALPEIRADLGADNGIEWVVTGYLLAVAASQPATAWMADRLGRKRVYVWALCVFTVGSLLCAMAPTLGALIAFRVLQGLGGGALMPVGMAIVFEVFPPERRGQAFAWWGVASMAGPAIGPTLGGYLLTQVSWHWLFLVNGPIGAIGIVLALRLLRDSGHRDDRRLDVLGLVLGAGGLTLTLLGVSQSPQWGWGAPGTLGCMAAGLVMLAAFVMHELRVPAPLVQLRMFRIGAFSISITIIALAAAAQFTRLVFIPLQLEELRGYSPLQVGVLFIPQAAASAVGMLTGGRLGDRIGARPPVIAGCLAMATAGFLLGNLSVTTPIWVIGALMSLQGFGMGLAMAPATVMGMNSLPSSLVAQASAVRSLSSQVSGAVAIAALSTLVAGRMGGEDASAAHQQTAYNSAFLVVSAGMLFAAVLATRLPRRTTRRGGADTVILDH